LLLPPEPDVPDEPLDLEDEAFFSPLDFDFESDDF